MWLQGCMGWKRAAHDVELGVDDANVQRAGPCEMDVLLGDDAAGDAGAQHAVEERVELQAVMHAAPATALPEADRQAIQHRACMHRGCLHL